MPHLAGPQAVYLIGFAVVLCISWLAFSIDIPDRATECPQCDAERREAVFMRDAMRAQGPEMVTILVLLNSLMWPAALLGVIQRAGSHRRHSRGN